MYESCGLPRETVLIRDRETILAGIQTVCCQNVSGSQTFGARGALSGEGRPVISRNVIAIHSRARAVATWRTRIWPACVARHGVSPALPCQGALRASSTVMALEPLSTSSSHASHCVLGFLIVMAAGPTQAWQPDPPIGEAARDARTRHAGHRDES